MGIIDFLKKIGVLKMGSVSYKGDVKDRPFGMITGNLDYIEQDKKDQEEREKNLNEKK